VARFLDRLGRTVARHKWITIGIWVLLAVVVGGWAQTAGGKTTDVYTIPGAQSQKAQATYACSTTRRPPACRPRP
jgi:putative drug exporter of the RND superfamily